MAPELIGTAMTNRLIRIGAAAVMGVLVLGGCSSSGSSPSAGSSTSAGARNLVVTAAVRTALLQAGARLHQLPASDYTGLTPGKTYYAYDAGTATYWAGAALVANSSSQTAHVSVQDDGSYLLFTRAAGQSWTGYDVGLAGIEGAKCPVTVPAAVLAEWSWKRGTCRPSG